MDQVMTTTNLSSIIPELWSANFYPTLLAQLPFESLISREFEGEISNLGDTINITKFPQFGLATELLEDEKNDADSITLSTVQLIINKQIVKDYIITNKAMQQSIDAATKLRDLAMHSVMKKMQSLIINEIIPSAATPDHQISYTAGTTLALVDCIAAKELLDLADVPDDGTRVMTLGPSQANDLFNIAGFVSRDFSPNADALTSGAITAPVMGFKVKTTSQLGNTSYYFHPSFLTLAVQKMPEVKTFDLGVEGKRAERVNLTTLLGLKQLDNVRVVSIS